MISFGRRHLKHPLTEILKSFRAHLDIRLTFECRSIVILSLGLVAICFGKAHWIHIWMLFILFLFFVNASFSYATQISMRSYRWRISHICGFWYFVNGQTLVVVKVHSIWWSYWSSRRYHSVVFTHRHMRGVENDRTSSIVGGWAFEMTAKEAPSMKTIFGLTVSGGPTLKFHKN